MQTSPLLRKLMSNLSRPVLQVMASSRNALSCVQPKCQSNAHVVHAASLIHSNRKPTGNVPYPPHMSRPAETKLLQLAIMRSI